MLERLFKWRGNVSAGQGNQSEPERNLLHLNATDSMHERVEKAMRYAGFANPNHLGAVDSIAHIMSEYERHFGLAKDAPLPSPYGGTADG